MQLTIQVISRCTRAKRIGSISLSRRSAANNVSRKCGSAPVGLQLDTLEAPTSLLFWSQNCARFKNRTNCGLMRRTEI